MSETNYNAQSPIPIDDCGMATLAKTLGDKWSLLIIRQVFYRVARFEDICRELKIPRAVLTGRLAKLVELKILKKVPYQQKGQRARYAYELDKAGNALLPLLVEAMQWGDQYVRKQPSGLQLISAESGESVRRAFVDDSGRPVPADAIRFKVVPGE